MKIVKTACDICGHADCSLKITVDSGRIIEVEGDKDDPRTRGDLCPQGLHIGDITQSEERLKKPLIKNSNDEWRPASWDEALSLAAKNLLSLKEKYGAKSIAIGSGYSREHIQEVRRYYDKLGGLIGTPNLTVVDHTCSRPRKLGLSYVVGNMDPWRSADVTNSNCLVLWGINPAHDPPRIRTITKLLEEGKTLIVVDPRKTPFAKKADLHLQLRPGTDGALALSMINVIVNEGLHDEDFIERWTVGFDELKELAGRYPLDKASKITWLDEDDIIEAAKTYATRGPSSIDLGNGLDQHTNNFQMIRAIASLIAVSGNLDVPGGNLLTYQPNQTGHLVERSPREAIGQERFPLAERGHMPSFWRSILTGEPYRIRGMIMYGTNPVLTDCDTKLVREALSEVEFLVVVDLFMTETARFADIVLPAASFLETDSYRGGEKVLDPPGEAWPEEKIILELARKMGYGEGELVMESSQARGATSSGYRKYLKNGFQTSSGKVEFYSEKLRKCGLSPLPEFVEPAESPLSKWGAHYPLILSTSAKVPMYTHSQFRNIPSLRKLMPENYFTLNPATASHYMLKDGNRVTVESPSGRLSGSLRTSSDLLENVLQVYHGFSDMNANTLVSSEYFDPGTGSPGMKSSLCRIVAVGN
ncbi:MAG: molybdopterin-dependent oxidoreductase [Candidatus Bathyarchaeia archaeon]|jgi:anaerobic selenocysteine-containing dehydrogenase